MKQDIKEARYEGYFWKSDQSMPKVLEGKEKLSFTLTDGENPFVVEGLLWDSENKISISIRYVDGHYHVSNHQVEDCTESQATEVSYLSHRLPGVKKLKFLRLWKKEQDPLCEDMDTLQFKTNIFVGLEK